MSLFDVLRVLVVRRVSCVRALLALLAMLGIMAGASPRLFAQVMQLPVWTQQTPSSVPPARSEAMMAYDAATGQIVLFGGGSSSYGVLGDTWTWNGSTWTQQFPVSSPPARWGATMAYDAASGQVVLFGGSNDTIALNDTWTWNGSTWTELIPVTSPPARAEATMAYDAASEQVVLFGGTSDATTPLSDTWTWDGTNWAQQNPGTSPPARWEAMTAYDVASGQVVLFGGGNATTALSDTWTWNGSTWTQQSPSSNPPVIQDATMAYDAASGEVVLFGGYNNASFLADSWILNGSTWTQLPSLSGAPPARDSAAMAYSAVSGQVVLFGGANGTSILSDTFTLQAGALNLGTANVCPAGAATPPPCSQSGSVSFSVAAGTTIGSIHILTQGATTSASGTPLDFNATSPDTSTTLCTAQTYSSATTCTVDVTFTPARPGARDGAVVIEDGSGDMLATTYLYGTGTAPQVTYNQNYNPSATNLLGGGFSGPQGVAVDAKGDVFVADTASIKEMNLGCSSASCAVPLAGGSGVLSNNLPGLAVDGAGNVFVADYGASKVEEILAAGGYTTVNTLGGSFTFDSPTGVAVDGSGNVYVADYNNNAVEEISAGSGYSAVIPMGGGFAAPQDVAVDGNGNVYVADTNNNAIKEMPAGCASSSCVTTLGGGFNAPVGVAVGATGIIYVGDTNNNLLKEMPAGCASSSCVATLGGSFSALQGVAVDGNGNVYVADTSNVAVKQLDYADPPVLPPFVTPTAVDSTDTTDGPQTVTVSNIGNLPLSISSLTATNGILDDIGATPCSTSASVAAGATCVLDIEFAPVTAGIPLSGSLVLTDNNLNATTTPGTQQSITFSGVAAALAPTVNVMLPPTGPAAGGTVVILVGTGFTGATSVLFGTAPATSILVASDTQLIATSPAGTGQVDVTVTTPAGTSATSSADLFTYQQAQTIAFLPPPSGVAGNSLTLTAIGGSSGNPVIFSVVSGPATASGTNGSTLTFTASGLVVVEADQAGSPSYAAAAPVQETILVSAAPASSTAPTTAVGSASATQTAYLNITTAGTLGAINVVTQGATGLDFNVVAGGTCATGTTYSVGQVCTVQYTFTPVRASTRPGGIVASDALGSVLANSYISGLGTGPQLAYPPLNPNAVTTTLASGLGNVEGVAVDASGDVYYTYTNANPNAIIEQLAINGVIPPHPVTNYFVAPTGPVAAAVDGSGNLYAADYNGDVTEYLAINGTLPAEPRTRSFTAGLVNPQSIAIDLRGNVYVADAGSNQVVEFSPVNGVIPTSATPTVLGSGYQGAFGVAVDAAGDVFVSDHAASMVYELMAVAGSVPSNPTVIQVGSGFNGPLGLSVDALGNVYVSDQGSSSVKQVVAVNGAVSSTSAILTLGSGFSTPVNSAIDANGNLYIADNGNQNVSEFNVLNAPTFTYPNTAVGSSSAAQSVPIENIGNAPLTIAQIASTNYSVATAANSPCGSTLAPAAICNAAASFTPTLAGTDPGTLTFTDNNLNATTTPGTQQTIALNGTAFAGVAATKALGSEVLTENHPALAFTPVTGSGGTGSLSYSVLPALPSGLSMVPSTGLISGTPTVRSAATTYTVTVTDANGATATATFSLAVDSPVAAATAVATTALTENHANPFTPVTGTGGTAPLSYSVSPGLPSGLSMVASTGTISGTPTAPAAAANYTVTITDANSATATASFSLTVDSAVTATQAVATTTLNFGQAVVAFTPVSGSGGTGTLSYSVSPSLPPGLSMASAGTISGTPTATAAAANYTVTVTDANGATAKASFSLAVVSPVVPVLSFAPIAPQVYGTAPFTVSATSASSGAVTYAVVGGPATITGNVVTLTDVGTVVLSASQAASEAYAPATATTSFTVASGFSITTGTSTGSGSGTSSGSSAGSSIASATTTPGGTATYGLAMVPAGTTYPDPVSFSVLPSSLPTGAIAIFNPKTIPANSPAVPVKLTIQTSTSQTARNQQPSSGLPLAAVALGFLLLPLAGRKRLRKMPRLWVMLIAMAVSLGAVLGLTGCGGGSGFFNQPAQSYNVTVIATDLQTNATVETNLTLTVQ